MYLRSPNDHLGLLGWVLNLLRSILIRDRGREDKEKSRRQPDHRGRHWHDIAKEHQGATRSQKSKERILPQNLQKESSPADTLILDSVKDYVSVGLSHPVCSNLL